MGLRPRLGVRARGQDRPRPCVLRGERLDSYGRSIARCFLRVGDLGAWMVEAGGAVAYRRYGTDYVRAEERARAARHLGERVHNALGLAQGPKVIRASAALVAVLGMTSVPASADDGGARESLLPLRVASSYSGNPRKTYSQIGSCAEALWLLANFNCRGQLCSR